MTELSATRTYETPVEVALPRGAPTTSLLNAWTLKSVALEHVRKLAGKIWTDHNIHDPGIAILELLCFALSDIGYRTNMSIEDLLAEMTGDDTQTPPPQFFTAREILTCAPVTALDFRRLLIDVTGVRNAWIRPAGAQETPLFVDREAEALAHTLPPLGGKNTGVDDRIQLRGLNAAFLELDRQIEVRDDLNYNSLKADLDIVLGTGADRRVLTLDLEVGLGGFFDPAMLPTAGSHPAERYRLPRDRQQRRPYVLYQADWTPSHPDWLLRDAESVEVVGLRPLFPWLERQVVVPLLVRVTVNGASKLLGVCLRFAAEGRINLNASEIRNRFRRALISNQRAWLNRLIARHQVRVRRRLEIVETALARLNANRALCEDYHAVYGMRIEEIGLCADIELDPNADSERVYSDIRYQVEQFLAPDIEFRSLEHLLDAKLDPSEIFDGPALEHGFIVPDSLSASVGRDEVNSSDIMNILVDVEGVVAVRDVMMSSYVDGEVREKNVRWSLPLINDDRHVPRLALDKSKLIFFKGVVPCGIDLEEAEALYEEAIAKRERTKLAPDTYDIEPPAGSFRNLEKYTSVQTHLPLNFGVGPEGLAASESDERKAKAAQLKAFLMFFDQMLANYLAQLSRAKDQLSVNNNVTRSYHVGPVYDAPSIAPLIADFVETDGAGLDPADRAAVAEAWALYVARDPHTGYRRNLEAIAETGSDFYRRHNQILDHLLARFSEQFTDYAMLLHDLQGRRRASAELIEDKSTFLSEYPALSRARGNGFNYFVAATSWDPGNVSGLAHRVARLVGIPPRASRNLAPEPGTEVVFSRSNAGKWTFRLTVPSTPDAPQLAMVTAEKSAGDASEEQSRARFFDFIRIVTEDIYANYETLSDGTISLEVRNPDGDHLAASETSFSDQAAASTAFQQLLDFIDTTYFHEGMHVVEHVLLRPFSAEDSLMPVSLGEDCTLAAELVDPYSYRATVVLPALARRFRNQDMRRLVETTLRMEAPAHVSLKICWIDHAQLVELEAALESWCRARAGLNPPAEPLTKALTKLLGVLGQLKSIYPIATLHDCEDPDETINPVVLGHTALGSFTESRPDPSSAPTDGD